MGVLGKEAGRSGGGSGIPVRWAVSLCCPVSLETGCGHLDQRWVPKSEAASSFEIQAGTGAVPSTLRSAAQHGSPAPVPELLGSECILDFRIFWITERHYGSYTTFYINFSSRVWRNTIIKYCVAKC